MIINREQIASRQTRSKHISQLGIYDDLYHTSIGDCGYEQQAPVFLAYIQSNVSLYGAPHRMRTLLLISCGCALAFCPIRFILGETYMGRRTNSRRLTFI